ncbi:MAG: DUF4252 domain-containing protein [Flavobacteriaceae bacterium]|nr:DUF4252 domain-containing protein [Flavobacteriaceae bacterium]
MKSIKHLIAIFILIGIISCEANKSLQEYIVEKQQDNAFISIDIPSSILTLKEENNTVETLNALKSIKKFNFLGMQLTAENKNTYIVEKQQIKAILSNKKFKEILRAKTGQREVTVKYLGDEENIDEVVFFGTDNEKGLAIVRVLGENMNPAAMVQLLNKINIEKDSSNLKSLHTIFDKIK